MKGKFQELPPPAKYEKLLRILFSNTQESIKMNNANPFILAQNTSYETEILPNDMTTPASRVVAASIAAATTASSKGENTYITKNNYTNKSVHFNFLKVKFS